VLPKEKSQEIIPQKKSGAPTARKKES